MFSNLTPSQEPAVWGALVYAVVALAVVFAPRLGVTLNQTEQAAIIAVATALVALFVRSSSTPNASSPAAPPKA